MELYTITLICHDRTVKTEVSSEMLFQLIQNISKNGRETVHTNQNSYEVIGVLVGDMKEKAFI